MHDEAGLQNDIMITPPIQNVAMLQTIERGHAFKNVAMTPYLLVLVFRAGSNQHSVRTVHLIEKRDSGRHMRCGGDTHVLSRERYKHVSDGKFGVQ